MLPRRGLILLTALLLLLTLPVLGAEPKVMELKPKWKRGDTLRYEVTRTVVRELDGKAGRKVVTRTPVELEVVDVDEEGTVVRWTQGSTVHEDPRTDDDPLARATSAIQKGLDIDLDLDVEGVLLGVRNWKDIRITGHKVQDAVLAQMAKAGLPKSSVEPLRKETDKLFASKESIEATFARQAQLLFFPFGEEYELEKSIPYEGETANPFGGDEPLPAKGEYTLKSVDKDGVVAVIVFKQSLDPKEVDRSLRKWYDDAAKKTGKPAPKELPGVQLDETMEYEFDLAAGWAKTVTHTRVFKEGTKAQTETVTLIRKR